jgi:hypothetical protein
LASAGSASGARLRPWLKNTHRPLAIKRCSASCTTTSTVLMVAPTRSSFARLNSVPFTTLRW